MKKSIVIGASSGIGEGLARLLAENNYKVGITGRRIDLLEKLSEEKPGSYIVKSFDITDIENVVKNIKELVSELGGLDLLVISSGIGKPNDDLDFRLEKSIIDTNVTGFVLISDWAYNYFKDQGSGHLAGISSVAGIRGWKTSPAYNASKAFQINYMEGLRNKAFNSRSHIIITDIRPGYVDTAMAVGSSKFWVAPVNKAAKQIFKAIRHRKRIVYITRRWGLIAFLYKLVPTRIYERV